MSLRQIQLGYCTNVHAGADFDQTRSNLESHACEVKERVCPNHPMALGLWLSASSAETILRDELEQFRDWLAEKELIPFTLNGFPFGNFHSEIVKHDVYKPTWNEEARLQYTLNLIEILDCILPVGLVGSISTLPLGWPTSDLTDELLIGCARNLQAVANRLAKLEDEKGRRIILCLEPEPGCILQRSTDLTRFFEEYLLRDADERMVRRYLGVCHDVCHAEVMFETQKEVLDLYRSTGIEVGKVQVSSAIRLKLDSLNHSERESALQQLAEAHEPRYLHQTLHQLADSEPTFYENLPEALEQIRGNATDRGEIRAHFHVPVYLERFGLLEASQSAILECLPLCQEMGVTHFEVETYTWGVLPSELQMPNLAAGIAQEMLWLQETLASSLTQEDSSQSDVERTGQSK